VFTGIVEEVGKVASAQTGNLVIAASNVLMEMKLGDSIAVNGVCLTIASIDADSFSVDVMPETSRKTNLDLLRAGDSVNLERALSLGGRIGGHLVQGHVDDKGRVTSVTWEGGTRLIRFDATSQVMRYVVEKGFISVDGISLTVASKDTGSFLISVVDYTQKHTTLSNRRAGDLVNIEVDIIAKYVEQLNQTGLPSITVDYLQESGFLVT
jgi:riboflavin synthase